MQQVIIVGTPETGFTFNGQGFIPSEYYGDPHQSSNLFSHPGPALIGIYNHIADMGGDPSDMGGPSNFFPTKESTTESLTSVPGKDVAISFDPNANHLVTPAMAKSFDEVLVSEKDIVSIRISATTNGHIALSNHGVGDAVDINYINDVHVTKDGPGLEVAKKLETAAMKNDNVRYVEGPMGNYVRNTPGGDWMKAADMGKSEYTHVHFEVFPGKK